MPYAYNIAASHRLEPVSGFDEITHLQFTAPLNADAAKCDNGTGEEFGLPAGSVVSVNPDADNLEFIAGAVGTAMPCFLLWNTTGADGMAHNPRTANGRHYAGTLATSALGNVDNRDWLENSLMDADGAYVSGGASSLKRVVAEDGTISSYTLRGSIGNHTAWPATCGLELNSTEFDLEGKDALVRGALLTAPAADSEAAGTDAIGYQKRRGGYLKAADLSAAPTASGLHNICGTVSRGIIKNENAVDVLYFWAERTLLPQVATT